MFFFVLIFTVLVLAIALVAARRRHFLLAADEDNRVNNRLPIKAVSLFAPNARALAEIENQKLHRERAIERERTLAWASLVEFGALPEIKSIADEKLRRDALEILTERAAKDEDVCALVAFVLAHREIEPNNGLVRAFQKIWRREPNRLATVQMFRLAAETNDAELLLDVLTESEQFAAANKLNDLTASEISDLANSHYWLLDELARTSGAGFMLRQKFAQSRR